MPSAIEQPTTDTHQPNAPEAVQWLEQQAEETSAQAKSVRVLDWIVRSVCDPQSLVH